MLYDVAILGSGSIGVSAALHLARRGLVTLALDQNSVPNTAGEHFGAARMFRTAYYEHPAYVPLLRRSRDLWLALNRDARRTLYHETGGLYLGLPDGELIRESARAAREHAIPHQRLSPRDLAERFPAFRPPPGVEGLWEPAAGLLTPEAAVAAMAHLAREAGATIGTHEQVLELHPGDELTIITDRTRYTARQAIVAAGAWAQRLLDASALPAPAIAVTRQPLGWFQPAAPDHPAFSLGAHPCWAYEDQPGSLLYGFPALPGDPDFRVARHRRGPLCDPDAVDREPAPADLADFEPAIRALLPAAGRVSRAAVAFYSNSPDGHFIIDRLPGQANILIAAGLSGHGFKFAPVVGEALADLAQHGSTPHDLSLFSLTRLGPVNP